MPCFPHADPRDNNLFSPSCQHRLPKLQLIRLKHPGLALGRRCWRRLVVRSSGLPERDVELWHLGMTGGCPGCSQGRNPSHPAPSTKPDTPAQPSWPSQVRSCAGLPPHLGAALIQSPPLSLQGEESWEEEEREGGGASAGVQVVGEGPHCRADHQQGELWKQTHPTAFCSSAGHIPPSESLAEPLQNAFPVAKHILRVENPGTGSTPPCSIEIYVFR